MICVAGMNSVIIHALKRQRPYDTFVRCGWNLRSPDLQMGMLPNCDRFIYCAGVLFGHQVGEYTAAKAVEAFAVNYWNALQFCERALKINTAARICVIGSMSGIEGSFDEVYAGTKAALHLYCRTRAVRAPQQLVCVAPTIISNAAMTTRRPDFPKVLGVRASVRAEEVAAQVADLLWSDLLVSNYVVEMPGSIRGSVHSANTQGVKSDAG